MSKIPKEKTVQEKDSISEIKLDENYPPEIKIDEDYTPVDLEDMSPLREVVFKLQSFEVTLEAIKEGLRVCRKQITEQSQNLLKK
jgi:hypothetical protein